MRKRLTQVTLAGALALGITGWLTGPAAATAGGDPPGNNGTIKIDGQPFDDAPDNEPHPGCVFQLDFYGFDEGADFMADVSFEAVAPTAGGTVHTDSVPIGEDSHAGGGSETGLDASRTYDLSADLANIEPHPQQGWHIRVTIHADGSQGSDVKHKVFWVSDCATNAAVESTTETDTETAPVAASPPAATESTTVAATPAAPETASSPEAAPSAEHPEVMGISITRSPEAAAAEVAAAEEARTPAVSGESLARTGMSLGLAALGIALVGGGALVLRARRALVPT